VRLVNRQFGEATLDALVRVPQTLFEPQDLFADHGKSKMTRLDDAGVHRPDGNLVYAVALDAHEWVAAAAFRVFLPRSPVGVRGIDPKLVGDCTLHAARRGKQILQSGVLGNGVGGRIAGNGTLARPQVEHEHARIRGKRRVQLEVSRL